MSASATQGGHKNRYSAEKTVRTDWWRRKEIMMLMMMMMMMMKQRRAKRQPALSE